MLKQGKGKGKGKGKFNDMLVVRCSPCKVDGSNVWQYSIGCNVVLALIGMHGKTTRW